MEANIQSIYATHGLRETMIVNRKLPFLGIVT
jgi:hypothetical protein